MKKCQKQYNDSNFQHLNQIFNTIFWHKIYISNLSQMLSEYAYAKLQSMNGQQYFIRGNPALIASKRCKQWSLICNDTKVISGNPSSTLHSPQCLAITNIMSTFPIHAVIYYHQLQSIYKIFPLTSMKINQILYKQNDNAIEDLTQNNKTIPQLLSSQNKNSIPLSNVTKILLMSDQQPNELYYFCLPLTTPQRLNNGRTQQQSHTQIPIIQHQTNGSKWSNDDHQQLKKLLLQYGYGRWKQIQRSSSAIGGKLDNKVQGQIKAYSNGFLRALGLSLPEDQTNLKIFLQKLIEQNNPEFIQFQPNIKQWDQHIMFPQRSIQYTKRLQLLYRVKTLIRKYREDSLKNMAVKDHKKVNWDGLLNFIPQTLLFGQRPAVWWAKKHDIDLLLGVYKYGYANYVAIRNAKQYCFAQLERNQTYQDLPVADNLTRRLKKLINTIVKIQQNQGQIDFDEQASSQQDQKAWNDTEKKILFQILTEFGVSITNDNRSNWGQLKDKVKNLIKDFSKTSGQVQKMVSRIRWNCQIIQDEKGKDDTQNNAGGFKITYDQAVKFSRNINILQFVRRTILAIDADNYKLFLKEVEERGEALPKDHPAYIDNCKNADQQILNHVNKSGITPFPSLKLNQSQILARIQWLCDTYKQVKQKLNEKKKNRNKTFDQMTKKRAKFQLSRDKEGHIKFPININPSLILVATGKICVLSNYHSQHNLFPIGYISIRTHASMFNKGVRAKYRCQILQGEGRPIYKVTPQQDPENPIIRDSSTGCWVHVCQKVNNLQQVKKQKVTISGTERFGLLEPNVVRLLEDLPQAQKCNKYKFKKNLPEGSKQ